MNSQQDLPLKTDIAARFVPKIVALMVYLGTLCFVFTLFLLHSMRTWEGQLTTQLTIEVPTTLGVSSAIIQSDVLQLLHQMPDIEKASPMPQQEMTSLLQSLVGNQKSLENLALPIIIDVTLKDKNTIDVSALTARLKAISPLIQVTDHRGWESQVLHLIHTSVLIAFAITVFVLLAALATTTFAARTSLLIHRQVIEVLSLIGATHTYIANQFQMNALKQGLIASGIGSGLAFCTFIALNLLFQDASLSLLFGTSFFWQAFIVFLLAPPLTALLMMLVARHTVMKTLLTCG